MKIQVPRISIGQNFGSINRNGKEKILEFLDVSITTRFLVDRSKKILNQLKVIFDQSKIVNEIFLHNFLMTVQRV